MEYCFHCIELHCIERLPEECLVNSLPPQSVRSWEDPPHAAERITVSSAWYYCHTLVQEGMLIHSFLSPSRLAKRKSELQRLQQSGFCATTSPWCGRHHFGPWQSSQIPERGTDKLRYGALPLTFLLHLVNDNKRPNHSLLPVDISMQQRVLWWQ